MVITLEGKEEHNCHKMIENTSCKRECFVMFQTGLGRTNKKKSQTGKIQVTRRKYFIIRKISKTRMCCTELLVHRQTHLSNQYLPVPLKDTISWVLPHVTGVPLFRDLFQFSGPLTLSMMYNFDNVTWVCSLCFSVQYFCCKLALSPAFHLSVNFVLFQPPRL